MSVVFFLLQIKRVSFGASDSSTSHGWGEKMHSEFLHS